MGGKTMIGRTWVHCPQGLSSTEWRGGRLRKSAVAAGVLCALAAGGPPARADLQAQSVRLNGAPGTLNVAPGSTVSIAATLHVTNSEDCPGCPAEVVLALDDTPLQCLVDASPGPDPLALDTTFDLPSDQEGVFRLYAVLEEEGSCEAAVERYRQKGAAAPDRPRTP